MRKEAVAMKEAYSLLRRIFGSSISSKELLNFAAVAVEFFAAKAHDESHEGYSTQTDSITRGRSFEEWPVDMAMEDGGWNILEYEYSRNREEKREFGYLKLEGDSVKFVDPPGFHQGDHVHPESLQWLSVDKQFDEKAGGRGWAIDGPGVRFYEIDFDD